MKSIQTAALAATLACLALPAAVTAQSIPLYVDGGVSFPGNEIDGSYDTGFNVGLGIGLPLTSRVTVRGDVAYSRFGIDEQGFVNRLPTPVPTPGPEPTWEADGSGFGSLVAQGLLQLDLAPPRSTYRPYALAGVGYYHANAGTVTLRDSSGGTIRFDGSSSDGLATTLGAGASFYLGPDLGLFLEGRWTRAWSYEDDTGTNDVDYFPIKIGVVLNP